MNDNSKLDLVVYGASGYTGILVAEYLNREHRQARWGMAGRNLDKLAQVRDQLGPGAEEVPLIVADSDDPESLAALAKRTRCVLTTVGPYQLYGSGLVAACAENGTDYLDLSGEPLWMKEMIDKWEDTARQSGARILFSCGFDSVPFDLGVQFLQRTATERFGTPLAELHCRVQSMRGTFSGGTAASLGATLKALGEKPELVQTMLDPFALAGGFRGPQQPDDSKPIEDEVTGLWVAPFIMATINTKNIHRSNMLMGHCYGEDFRYDEMMIAGQGEEGRKSAEFLATANPIGGADAPKPGEGPTKEEREAGNYDLLFIGDHPEGGRIRARVTGDMDPGYGSTSKIIAEAALCLIDEVPDLAGGIYTPAAALGEKLQHRLTTPRAGLTFTLQD